MQASKRIEKLKEREKTLREELTQLTITLNKENADLTSQVLQHLDMNDVDPKVLTGGIIHLKQLADKGDQSTLESFSNQGSSLLKKMKGKRTP